MPWRVCALHWWPRVSKIGWCTLVDGEQEMIGESSGEIRGGDVVFRHNPSRSYNTFSPNPVSPAQRPFGVAKVPVPMAISQNVLSRYERRELPARLVVPAGEIFPSLSDRRPERIKSGDGGVR